MEQQNRECFCPEDMPFTYYQQSTIKWIHSKLSEAAAGIRCLNR